MYERLLSVVHNENTTDLYATLGRRLGRLLYEGRWFDPEALILKEGLTRWVASAVSGKVTVELRRGDDYTIVDTQAPTESAYGTSEKLSMEKTASAFFAGGSDRRARDGKRSASPDSRELFLHVAKAPGRGRDRDRPATCLLGEGEDV